MSIRYPASYLRFSQFTTAKDGYGEQHCRIYCEQNEDQEETLRGSESEALPSQRPSSERPNVGSEPFGESIVCRIKNTVFLDHCLITV